MLLQKMISDMWEKAPEQAGIYVTAILVCYLLGLIFILLHFIKQKYGQISLYDIYFDLMPASNNIEINIEQQQSNKHISTTGIYSPQSTLQHHGGKAGK